MNDQTSMIDGIADIRSKSNANSASHVKTILLVEHSEFFRGCLGMWLRAACPEFEITTCPDMERAAEAASTRLIAAVVMGPCTFHKVHGGDEEELAPFRLRLSNVPVVAIVVDDMPIQVEGWVERLNLSGYVPTSSSPEVASAALRLVMAGGTYFPRNDMHNRAAEHASIDIMLGHPLHYLATKLTIRERDVFERLGQGTPNKIIAHELNMSLSTVKAHVHNIIQKFNVRNRTEAVVAVRAMSLGMPSRE